MEVYGIGPGKPIGVLKEYVKEAILDGVIGNDFEEADKLMREKASEMGLVPVK
jgi:poly(A) polymerase